MSARPIGGVGGLVVGIILLLVSASIADAPSTLVPQVEGVVLPEVLMVATTSAPATASPMAAPTLSDGWRIAVPRLGIDLPLVEGDLDRDLVRQATPVAAAFRFPWGALPGAPGNTYVYAHARVGMFLALWNARLGDEIVVTRPDGPPLRFLVGEIHPRVASDDLAFLQPTDDERLTLQTSTGPRPTDPRFVVVARRDAAR